MHTRRRRPQTETEIREVRRARRLPTSLVVLVAALGLAAGLGCATSGDVGDLDERVTSLENRVGTMERKLEDTRDRVTELEETAQNALRRAESAEAEARAAAEDADASARKVERVFEKSVSK